MKSKPLTGRSSTGSSQYIAALQSPLAGMADTYIRRLVGDRHRRHYIGSTLLILYWNFDSANRDCRPYGSGIWEGEAEMVRTGRGLAVVSDFPWCCCLYNGPSHRSFSGFRLLLPGGGPQGIFFYQDPPLGGTALFVFRDGSYARRTPLPRWSWML